MTEVYNSTMQLELFGTVPIYMGFLIQILFALVLGGLVGFDRELKMKAAGFKTNIMICLGATIYTSIAFLNLKGASPVIDPNRVSAQIVSGIGFLGAGAIIQGRGGIIGLTTAATIWVVAAIGYTVGSGYPIIASIFSLSVLVTLRLINPVSILSEKKKDFKYYHLEFLSYGNVTQLALEILSTENIQLNHIEDKPLKPESAEQITSMYITAHPRAFERILPKMKEIIRIKKINHSVLDNEFDVSKQGSSHV